MKSLFAAGSIVLGLACGTAPAAVLPPVQITPSMQAALRGPHAAPAAAELSHSGDFNLVPGFTPTPATATGIAGGLVDAGSLGEGCIGVIDSSPSHVLEVVESLPFLRIMVFSTGDTTLVIRKPDGDYLCNDDWEGYNPMVEGAFDRGSYQIWVGDYSPPTEETTYIIGMTERSDLTPRHLQ